MKRFSIFFVFLFVSSALFAQSWDTWRTIPVFDGERVMPLSSFADQVVKDICGTSRPFIRLDDDVVDGLTRLQEEYAAAVSAVEKAKARQGYDNTATEQDSIFNYSQDKFLADLGVNVVSEVATEETITENVRRAIGVIDPDRLESIRRRIESLVPPQGRYFDSSELLLSWLGEPEVWNFIPIFDASESDYRVNILDVATANKLRSALYRIAPAQLEHSRGYKKRLDEIALKQAEQGDQYEPNRYDAITFRLRRAKELYEELTFHPRRNKPTRMIEILKRTTDFSAMQNCAYGDCLTAWEYLFGIGSGLNPNSTPDSNHPTAERWENIRQRIWILATAFDYTDAKGNPRHPHLDAVQRQFESLLTLIDANLEESAVLMETAYPGRQFRKAMTDSGKPSVLPNLFSNSLKENEVIIRKLVLRYHYSVKTFRREIEAAYLALFDNGRALRVLPIISEQTVGGESASLHVQPWATLQTVLYADDVMVRRFFDPRFSVTTPTIVSDGIEETAIPTSTEKAVTTPTEEMPSENELPDEFEKDLFGGSTRQREIETKSPSPDDSIRWIRLYFDRLVSAYEVIVTDIGWSDSGRRFNESAGGLRGALREAGEHSNGARQLLIDPSDTIRAEMLRKTSYPASGATYLEYRYFRLTPFYWMWVFAACSAFFVILAMGFGYNRKAILSVINVPGRTGPFHKTGIVNSAEEFLYWTSVAFLLLSVFITFLGGVMRAGITGWAPVTNMYETVVLSAFAAALFGLWYALYPLLNPAMSLAWRLSSFPSFPSLMSNFAAVKTPPPAEQAGQYAMRQAAIDFGMPGSNRMVDPDNDPEETERLMRQRNELFWRFAMVIPRLILMILTLWLTVQMCYGEYSHEHGVFAAMFEMLTMQDLLDWIVVVASLVMVVWFVPHLFLMLAIGSVLLFRPGRLAAEAGIVSRYQPEIITEEKRRRSELSGVFLGEANVGTIPSVIDDSWAVWLNGVRQEILDRKLYILVGAVVALLTGLAAHYNSTQFNPNIRPIAAVLRSNFWLTVHVIAIILSYAAATVAWGMAVIATGNAIFGRYRRETTADGKRRVHVPSLCETIAPSIHRLIRVAVFLLALGTILGARWADYSWGRFWGWDPKEVWALITLLFFLIVLHGRIGRLYGQFGIVLGGLFGSVAVIMTWYGINFVMNAGKHAYGGGTATNATILLIVFILVNLLWGAVAMVRYGAEAFGTETTEPAV